MQQAQLEIAEAKGLKFYLRPDTSDKVVYEDNVVRQSYYKHGITVEPGQSWMDVGGYIGTFAINLASQGAKVIAFEPDPDNAELFRKNLELNGKPHVALVEQAVIAGDAQTMLLYKNTFKGNMAANTLYPHWKREKPSVEISCINFLRAFEMAQGTLNSEELSIKFDCEGSEIEILETLPNLPIKQITLEYHFAVDPNCARYWGIANHLNELGFKIKSTAKVPTEGDWPNFRMQTIQVFCTK